MVGRSLTKSKDAILRACSETVCEALFPGSYLPTIRLVPKPLQVIGSGFFCDAGVKKFATAFSVKDRSDLPKLFDRTILWRTYWSRLWSPSAEVEVGRLPEWGKQHA